MECIERCRGHAKRIDAVEQLRILEGTPAYSVDITAKDLPQETNQMRALHFSKGCYLGQEIVERIRSRGNVHRTFSGFVLRNAGPTAGTPLLAEGKEVGEITSVAAGSSLPGAGEKVLALGTIRREVLDRTSDWWRMKRLQHPRRFHSTSSARRSSLKEQRWPDQRICKKEMSMSYARKRTAGHIHRSPQDFF